eukprot:scaffold8709_cov103-Isochrysis_galbana.AAC.1
MVNDGRAGGSQGGRGEGKADGVLCRKMTRHFCVVQSAKRRVYCCVSYLNILILRISVSEIRNSARRDNAHSNATLYTP